MDNINIIYVLEIYNNDNFICSYESEFPKEFKRELQHIRSLDNKIERLKANHIKDTYKFFKKILRNGIVTEIYRITEDAIL